MARVIFQVPSIRRAPPAWPEKSPADVFRLSWGAASVGDTKTMSLMLTWHARFVGEGGRSLGLFEGLADDVRVVEQGGIVELVEPAEGGPDPVSAALVFDGWSAPAAGSDDDHGAGGKVRVPTGWIWVPLASQWSRRRRRPR